MNENINTVSPNLPNFLGLSDDEIVDIELAKTRLYGAIDSLHQYSTIKTEAMMARALSNTVQELLVDVGVTTDEIFYNTYARKVLDKVEQVQDMLGIIPEDSEEERETTG